MKVLVDPEIFFYGRCGMVRYYSKLCQSLSETGVEIDIPLIVSNSDFIAGHYQKLSSFIDKLPKTFSVNRINTLSKKWYMKR